MKVLQFVAYGEPGGGTNHVMQLLSGLGSGFSTTLLTQKESYLYQYAKSRGIEVYGGDFFRSRVDPGAIQTVAATVKRIQPDLVHCHGGRAGFFHSFLPRQIPTVYTVHGFHHAQKPAVPRTFGWAAEFWTMRGKSSVLFVSHYDCELAVRQHLMARNTKHHVIHNGIKPLVPGQKSQKLGVGFVGRFEFQKNPQMFLDVVERLPHTNFVMVGDGELDAEVRAEVRRRGIEDRVRLLGGLDHASALEVISNLDVFVMTSRWEGLPLALLEAMFMKVPVVATRVGGVPEVIEDGHSGLLSDLADAGGLAAHVQTLLENTDLKNSIVANAYQRAHTQFSEEKMLSDIRGSYQEVVQSAAEPNLALTQRFWASGTDR
jgi:glycosyltransferase involved in cell wall biosynthesis